MRRHIAFDRITVLAAILFCVAYLTGCGAYTTSPALGLLYTDVKGPLTATGNASTGAKMLKGEATATSILGLIAQGDASIETAAKSAGITKIHHVDYRSENVLGLYAKFTVIVYGE